MSPHVPNYYFFKNLVRQFQGLLLYQHNLWNWQCTGLVCEIYILNAVPMLELCEIGDINLPLSVPKRFPILHCTFWLLFQMHNCPTHCEWFTPTWPRPRSSGHFGTRTSIKKVGVMRWRDGSPCLIEPLEKLYLLTRTPRRTFYLPR